MTEKVKQIRPLDGFANASDAAVVSRATLIQTDMTGNANFPTPPVDLAALKTATASLSALMAAALDGSKKVVAEKKTQRTAVIKMLRLLGRYVEVACKDDMAIFKSSGFEPASTTRTTTQPLSEKIRKIQHGANSGQIAVWIRSVAKASSYEFRYGAVGAGGAPPASWTTQLVATVKTPIHLSGLTPGTTYAFQARALVKDRYTDWSDSVTFMST
jgi:hypothetical protein